MLSLSDAIAKFEGYGVAGALPTTNNNPGDIVYGNFAAGYGAVKDPNSAFAIFPNSVVGFQAMNDLLTGPSYSGLTLDQAIAKWNGNGANSSAYASAVSQWTGIGVDQTINTVDPSSDYASNVLTSPISDPTSFLDYVDNLLSDVSSGSATLTEWAIAIGAGLVGMFLIRAIL